MHADCVAKMLVVLGWWSLPPPLHHSFQTACGALESNIFRSLDGAEGTAATPPTAEPGAGGRGRRAAAQHANEATTESSGVAVDLDAAVAFSRCEGGSQNRTSIRVKALAVSIWTLFNGGVRL